MMYSVVFLVKRSQEANEFVSVNKDAVRVFSQQLPECGYGGIGRQVPP